MSRRFSLYRRAAIAYLAACALPVFILAISIAKGGGWRPMLIGLPAYLTFFAAITYQFFKELRALRRAGEAGESMPDGKQ
ncbi:MULTISPECIES: hypothetical protein [Burkholderiaceae]|uniref:hypothetical protein n=1 Tax=Burkholderiaceae TaxID=119060 RepID=UPI00097740A1|nr:hypothetical protein [Burkholderia sp. b14]